MKLKIINYTKLTKKFTYFDIFLENISICLEKSKYKVLPFDCETEHTMIKSTLFWLKYFLVESSSEHKSVCIYLVDSKKKCQNEILCRRTLKETCTDPS